MNLSSTIDFDLKRFFLWWGRELSYWIPEKIRQALSDKSGYLFLSVSDEVLTLNRITNGITQRLSELPVNEEGQRQYQKLLTDDETLEKSQFILRLKPDQAIKKILYLPAAAKENLQQVVTFELDKYTPFTAEQVYFSVKQLGKEENGQIKALLIITPKETLDNILQQLNNLQIQPVFVDYEQAANDYDNDLDPYNLLPEKDRPQKNKITQSIIGLLSFALLILFFLTLAYPVWHEKQQVESLREQLRQLKNDTQLVQDKQLEIDEMVEETAHLIEAKKKAPSMIKIINSLSKLIADTTWIRHLKYNKAGLQIQGQSPAASSLIGALEDSPLFKNARFVSPLTQDKRTGLERFQIRVDVVTQKLENHE